MQKFVSTFILFFSAFYSFSQEVELPKINKIEELMKAEKPTKSPKTTAIVDTSDYGMNLDLFNIKQEKPRFDNYINSRPDEIYETQDDGTKVAKFENYIPGTDNNERLVKEKLVDFGESQQIDKTQMNSNNYCSIIYAFIFIIFSIFLIRRIYK